jgi:hypothetical protein
MAELTTDKLFSRYFLPLYPEDARTSLEGLAQARSTDANPGQNPAVLARAEEAALAFSKLAPAAFDAPSLALDFTDESVHRMGALLTRERRDAWLTDPGAGELPTIVNMAIHGALYVGACVVRSHGGAWQLRNPLWESLVRLDSRAGTGDLAIFHWWLKALGDEEIDDPRLVDRYRAHVEVPTARPEELPIIAQPDRRLPRLRKVRNDSLNKHLRAHLPELRSVGADFPSPERLDEMRFEWLDFLLIGGGRMLVMHGPTDRGVHLFWLDASGFNKSAYYAADAFPEHKVEALDDRLRVIVPVLGQARVHETLWWGA